MNKTSWTQRLSLEAMVFGIPAAQHEGDQLGQLSIAENMLTKGYDILLVAPQTNANLIAAAEEAELLVDRAARGKE